MLIKKEQAREKRNGNACTVWEYDFPNKNIWFATSIINWRLPDTGRIMNLECDEIYYVIAWTGTLHYDNEDYELHEGDTFFIEKKKPFRVAWNNLHLALPTQPAFFPEQHIMVE